MHWNLRRLWLYDHQQGRCAQEGRKFPDSFQLAQGQTRRFTYSHNWHTFPHMHEEKVWSILIHMYLADLVSKIQTNPLVFSNVLRLQVWPGTHNSSLLFQRWAPRRQFCWRMSKSFFSSPHPASCEQYSLYVQLACKPGISHVWFKDVSLFLHWLFRRRQRWQQEEEILRFPDHLLRPQGISQPQHAPRGCTQTPNPGPVCCCLDNPTTPCSLNHSL